MVMEPKYFAEEVIGHPCHQLRIWLDAYREVDMMGWNDMFLLTRMLLSMIACSDGKIHPEVKSLKNYGL